MDPYDDATFDPTASDRAAAHDRRRGGLSLGRAGESLSLERFAYGSPEAQDSTLRVIVEVKD